MEYYLKQLKFCKKSNKFNKQLVIEILVGVFSVLERWGMERIRIKWNLHEINGCSEYFLDANERWDERVKNIYYMMMACKGNKKCNLSKADDVINIAIYSENRVQKELCSEDISQYVNIDSDSEFIYIEWGLDKKAYCNIYVDMFEAMDKIVSWLKSSKNKDQNIEILPKRQIELREKTNSTFKGYMPETLHNRFFQNARKFEESIAIIEVNDDGEIKLSYKEVKENALKLAMHLQKVGVKKGDLVSLTLPRGYRQIISILGILAVGAAYVPVGINQPKSRYQQIIEMAKIKYILTDSTYLKGVQNISNIQVISYEEAIKEKELDEVVEVYPDMTAYVIFTSGTQGEPKGVEVSHASAENTIRDINDKFNITHKDCFFAISAIDFDLSVYDIFGSLSVGATLITLTEKNAKEPELWREYIDKYNVTIWNSSPALFEMYLIAGEHKKWIRTMRLVMLSGDWVSMKLFERLKERDKKCQFVALGGATEAAIWSIYNIVQSEADGNMYAYYGKPLANQKFYIVDKYGRNCPDYVPGEIVIGGRGIAKGYVGKKGLTADSFYAVNGEKRYRTGDIGRYIKDGNIEFLGRKDTQIKLNGFRIELDEIENAIEKCKGVKKSKAFVINHKTLKYIGAAVIPEWPAEIIWNEDQIQESICINEENNTYNDQTALTEKILVSVLGLYHMELPIKKEDLLSIFDIEYHEVVDYWLKWLMGRKVVKSEESMLKKGIRYCEVDINDKVIGNFDVDFYREILTGNKSKNILLENIQYSPEYISLNEIGIEDGIKKIFSILKERRSEERSKICIYGSGIGVLIKELLKLLPEQWKIDIIENSISLLNIAKQNLEEFRERCEFMLLDSNMLPFKYVSQYDFIVILNTLHTHKDLCREMIKIKTLVKENGLLLNLELNELPPLALINAAILEQGYKEYVLPFRPRNNDPILNVSEWKRLYEQCGFSCIKQLDISKSLFKLTIAQECDANREYKETNVLENISSYIPQYMIPKKLIYTYSFPLSVNGKVDINTLQGCFDEEQETCQEYETEMEKDVAEIWKEILDIQNIKRTDNFFRIGGDSLLATHFITIVEKEMGIPLKLRELFDNPTLENIGVFLEEKQKVNELEIEIGEI